MSEPSVPERMRDDWNRRAREDAHFYAGFGGRGQHESEFLASGAYLVGKIEAELARLPGQQNRRAWRALEIGCGPGRLMKPLSRDFGEIHGVDVSDEMVSLARERLAGIPHAHVHVTDGTTLASFADESFDFVYSYAVFQHIPDREIVLGYLHEIGRVLKPDAIFRGQFNDLPAAPYEAFNTWTGCRFTGDEIRAFTRENGFDLLDLSGASTQYLWTTWRKRGNRTVIGTSENSAGTVPRVRRITNSVSTEPAVTTTGRFSALSLWVEGFPPECELNGIVAFLGGSEAIPFYVGAPRYDGLRPQLSISMPANMRTGLHPLQVFWRSAELLRATVRVLPPPPPMPRIVAVTDGVNLLSQGKISSGSVKVVTEEMDDPARFLATVSGHPIQKVNWFLTDPVPPRCEADFPLPAATGTGTHTLEIHYGRRFFVLPITVL